MRIKSKFWLLFLIGLSLGLLICWIDARPNWDDTGISAGLIFLATGFLGLAMPKHAWIWALSVGIWIPFWNIILHNNYGSILALVIAFIGSYIGVFVHKLFLSISKQPK